MAGKKLPENHRRFVEQYLIDLNATQAAIRAGYSEKTANRQGSRLLSYADIAEAIAEAMKNRSERTAITQDYVLDGLKKEAEFTGKGSSHAARVSAFHLLGKHLGMFKDRVEHSGGIVQTHVYLPQKNESPAAT